MKKEYNKTEVAQSIAMLWDPLADEQRELLVDNISVCQMEQGDILYVRGDTPTSLYYLIRGKVCLRRNGIACQQIIRMVEPGSIFGYVAAIEGCSYKSTAIASSKTVIAQIPISLMFHFIWENSDFAMLFLKDLSSLLDLSIKRTMSLTQKHLRGRLAETLLLMKDKYGMEEDGQTLAVYLSREDLGQFSNMTTSNAIRTLSAFAKEGIVAIDGRKIKLLDVDELQLISNRG